MDQRFSSIDPFDILPSHLLEELPEPFRCSGHHCTFLCCCARRRAGRRVIRVIAIFRSAEAAAPPASSCLRTSLQAPGGLLAAVVLACVPLVMVVLLTIYVFAATGVLLFGGLMFPQNADLAEVSGFESGGAYVNSNFNDMPSAMVTLFDILVAGFDPNVVEGVAAVASTFQARLFFLIFYLVGSVVLFNVFTAFIIDAFIANYESEDIQAAGSGNIHAPTGESSLDVFEKVQDRHSTLVEMFKDELDEAFDE
ncbi:hypothetical protein CYMTET_15207 [Cymbomonas tetramitiformis]|uniref:Ion transport domain-containing protein n=1 Tax=Cymbomonas tetramitiformis TaxID=36881 RepID=A0AAE0GEI4_9CHLO|nr:hypothetical protein CYMTET_15207 [Cymbomonas tetramitiformis]